MKALLMIAIKSPMKTMTCGELALILAQRLILPSTFLQMLQADRARRALLKMIFLAILLRQRLPKTPNMDLVKIAACLGCLLR